MEELSQTYLSANVCNGSKESHVDVKLDERDAIPIVPTQPGEGEYVLEASDPFAFRRQLQIARHAFASDSVEPRANRFEPWGGSPVRTPQLSPGALKAK